MFNQSQIKHIVAVAYNDFIEDKYDDVKDNYSCWMEETNRALAWMDYAAGLDSDEVGDILFAFDEEYSFEDIGNFYQTAEELGNHILRYSGEFATPALNQIHSNIFLGAK